MNKLRIEKVSGREILDSRGNPTVLAKVTLADGTVGVGTSPSGASTGVYEAHELRDEQDTRYNGKGVLKAVGNINEDISHILFGEEITNLYLIDRKMQNADGTPEKSKLGANAMLAVSIACARAAANALGIPLYRFLGGAGATLLPVPMMNIINGGAHAKNSLDFQEYMIMPVGAKSFREALRMGTEVYHCLKKVLEKNGLSSAVGDEGGFAPDLHSVYDVLNILTEAIESAGYKCGEDICFALDVAASEWKPVYESEIIEAEHKITGQFKYYLPKSKQYFSSDQLITLYKELIEKYPIASIEDPLDEEDWEGWKKITKELGSKVKLVGDDLFVTNTARLSRGIENDCANSILIKLNQIGTVTETIEAIKMAHKAGYTAIVSHRSGETEDTTIADLCVACNCGYIKTGAPCRSERVAKYNRLLEIEEELGEAAVYAGGTMVISSYKAMETEKEFL